LCEICKKLRLLKAIDYDDKDIGTIKVQQREDGEELLRNPLLKLETERIDLQIAEAERPILEALILERQKYKDDFFLNQTLRRKLKMEKAIQKKEDEKKKIESALPFPKLEFSIEDEVNLF